MNTLTDNRKSKAVKRIKKIPTGLTFGKVVQELVFAKLEYGLTLKQIASKCNTTVSYARQLCTEYDYQYKKLDQFKYDWNSVDWSVCDIRISEQLGCTKESVRLHRKKKGLPASSRSICSGYIDTISIESKAVILVTKTVKGLKDIKLLGTGEWREAFSNSKLSYPTILKFLNDVGINNLKSYNSFRNFLSNMDFNWNLSNRDLALIWDVYDLTICWRRLRIKAGKPLLDGRCIKIRKEDKEYLALLELERVKAKKYYEKVRLYDKKRQRLISVIAKEYDKQLKILKSNK